MQPFLNKCAKLALLALTVFKSIYTKEGFWQTCGRLRLRFMRFLPCESDFSSRFGSVLQRQARLRVIRSELPLFRWGSWGTNGLLAVSDC
jgi:hypothetical protein